jgi:hypothetical protein
MGFHVSARNPASISTDQRFNAYRNRYMTSNSQSPASRRPSASETFHTSSRPSSYRPSRLNNFSSRDLDSASNAGSPLDQRRSSIADGAESVVSTSAQSTVWDELHELKSRIHKMELHDMGGTMSNGSGERPRTATTTVTTMSSSPRHPFKSGLSPSESVMGGPGAANMHPLLHQALARCKTLLNPALHRSLELAASDALEMVIIASNGSSQQGSMYSSASVVSGMAVDRQLKRKADNICRNLTDLCIALCAGKLDLPATSSEPQLNNLRRDSQDMTTTSMDNNDNRSRTYSRHASLEPETLDHARPGPSRALNRVEARRTSLMSTGAGNNSPRDVDSRNSLSNTGSTPAPQIIAKSPRTGTSLLRTRRRPTQEEEEEDDPPVRAPSRAATEVGSSIRKRSYRLSGGLLSSKVADREYTSQHPLPDSSPLAHATASLRRFNGSSLKAESPRSPTTTSSLLREGSRRYLERERATDSDATQEDDSTSRKSKRRSLGVYSSSARSSLGLGKRDSLKGRSMAAGGAES